MRGIIDLLIFVLVTFFCMILYNLSYAKINKHNLIINWKLLTITLLATILNLINLYYNSVEIKILFNIIIFIFLFI